MTSKNDIAWRLLTDRHERTENSFDFKSFRNQKNVRSKFDLDFFPLSSLSAPTQELKTIVQDYNANRIGPTTISPRQLFTILKVFPHDQTPSLTFHEIIMPRLLDPFVPVRLLEDMLSLTWFRHLLFQYPLTLQPFMNKRLWFVHKLFTFVDTNTLAKETLQDLGRVAIRQFDTDTLTYVVNHLNLECHRDVYLDFLDRVFFLQPEPTSIRLIKVILDQLKQEDYDIERKNVIVLAKWIVKAALNDRHAMLSTLLSYQHFQATRTTFDQINAARTDKRIKKRLFWTLAKRHQWSSMTLILENFFISEPKTRQLVTSRLVFPKSSLDLPSQRENVITLIFNQSFWLLEMLLQTANQLKKRRSISTPLDIDSFIRVLFWEQKTSWFRLFRRTLFSHRSRCRLDWDLEIIQSLTPKWTFNIKTRRQRLRQRLKTVNQVDLHLLVLTQGQQAHCLLTEQHHQSLSSSLEDNHEQKHQPTPLPSNNQPLPQDHQRQTHDKEDKDKPHDQDRVDYLPALMDIDLTLPSDQPTFDQGIHDEHFVNFPTDPPQPIANQQTDLDPFLDWEWLDSQDDTTNVGITLLPIWDDL